LEVGDGYCELKSAGDTQLKGGNDFDKIGDWLAASFEEVDLRRE